jgi:hypothetical protein
MARVYMTDHIEYRDKEGKASRVRIVVPEHLRKIVAKPS